MLMRHNGHGWHNASGLEVEELKKLGWIESSYEEHQKVVEAKKNPQKAESAIIEAQVIAKGKPGRKPKNL